jgi:hypothetical protein
MEKDTEESRKNSSALLSLSSSHDVLEPPQIPKMLDDF